VVLVAVALLHRQLAGLLLAAEYREYSPLMVWIAAGYVLAVCSQVVERVCYALHDTHGVLMIQVAGAALSVAIGIPMVLAFGLKGAAWAVPLYFGGQLALSVACARRAYVRADSVGSGARNEPTTRNGA
jgi:O-antigen/teichoic acid export membrane protein